jgi:hypothetical protein
MMECWNIGNPIVLTTIPLFHYSISFFLFKLCALRLLFVHPLIFIPGGSKRKEESISIEGFVFFVFTQKKLCDLCVLCG